MSLLRVLLEGGRTAFRPGEPLKGTAEWSLEKTPSALEVRLYWRAWGTDELHVETIASVRLDPPSARDKRPFTFVLPGEPYSFNGRVLSLRWGVELVAMPQKQAARAEFSLGPDALPIGLHAGTG